MYNITRKIITWFTVPSFVVIYRRYVSALLITLRVLNLHPSKERLLRYSKENTLYEYDNHDKFIELLSLKFHLIGELFSFYQLKWEMFKLERRDTTIITCTFANTWAPVTGGFFSQRASNAESIWRHHDCLPSCPHGWKMHGKQTMVTKAVLYIILARLSFHPTIAIH